MIPVGDASCLPRFAKFYRTDSNVIKSTYSPGQPARSSVVVWTILTLLTVVVFELTAQPGLAAMVFCSKFAWKNCLTAIWVLRNDPNRGRGRACFWFCLAVGTAKVLLCAFVVWFILLFSFGVILNGILPRGRPAPAFDTIVKYVVGCMWAGGIALSLQVVLTFVGCVTAYRHSVRVWIGPGLHQSRRQAEWPPRLPGPPQAYNPLGFFCLFSLLVMISAGVVVASTTRMPITTLSIGLPLAIGFFWVSVQVIARSPTACWPETE